jgi:hypothetical protein
MCSKRSWHEIKWDAASAACVATEYGTGTMHCLTAMMMCLLAAVQNHCCPSGHSCQRDNAWWVQQQLLPIMQCQHAVIRVHCSEFGLQQHPLSLLPPLQLSPLRGLTVIRAHSVAAMSRDNAAQPFTEAYGCLFCCQRVLLACRWWACKPDTASPPATPSPSPHHDLH